MTRNLDDLNNGTRSNVGILEGVNNNLQSFNNVEKALPVDASEPISQWHEDIKVRLIC